MEVFFEKREEGGLNVGAGGLEALVAVDLSDPGLDPGRLPDGQEEGVPGEAEKAFLATEVGMFGLRKEPLAGVQGKDGIADPGEVFGFTVGCGHERKTGWGV